MLKERLEQVFGVLAALWLVLDGSIPVLTSLYESMARALQHLLLVLRRNMLLLVECIRRIRDVIVEFVGRPGTQPVLPLTMVGLSLPEVMADLPDQMDIPVDGEDYHNLISCCDY